MTPKILLALIFMAFSLTSVSAGPVRLKDLVQFDGVRGNDLVGYGLVVGLNGTGDGIRNAPFTEEMMSSILERLGVNIAGERFRPKNVAAVLVTSVLPPFARAGNQVDVTVSTIGDAKSLLGGTLIMTIAGGISAEGDAARVVHGVPTAGSVVSGARVEREVDFDFAALTQMRLALRDPDFSTAERIEQAINRQFGRQIAIMRDAEGITVEPQRSARVVVDQRSGTIVMGEDVRISRVAVAQGNLALTIEETPVVEEAGTGLAELPNSTSLSDVVAGLNALGVSPLDMIDILKSIKAAGALHAEFVVQ